MMVDLLNLMGLKEFGVHENVFELFVSEILVCLFILFVKYNLCRFRATAANIFCSR